MAIKTDQNLKISSTTALTNFAYLQKKKDMLKNIELLEKTLLIIDEDSFLEFGQFTVALKEVEDTKSFKIKLMLMESLQALFC